MSIAEAAVTYYVQDKQMYDEGHTGMDEGKQLLVGQGEHGDVNQEVIGGSGLRHGNGDGEVEEEEQGEEDGGFSLMNNSTLNLSNIAMVEEGSGRIGGGGVNGRDMLMAIDDDDEEIDHFGIADNDEDGSNVSSNHGEGMNESKGKDDNNVLHQGHSEDGGVTNDKPKGLDSRYEGPTPMELQKQQQKGKEVSNAVGETKPSGSGKTHVVDRWAVARRELLACVFDGTPRYVLVNAAVYDECLCPYTSWYNIFHESCNINVQCLIKPFPLS